MDWGTRLSKSRGGRGVSRRVRFRPSRLPSLARPLHPATRVPSRPAFHAASPCFQHTLPGSPLAFGQASCQLALRNTQPPALFPPALGFAGTALATRAHVRVLLGRAPAGPSPTPELARPLLSQLACHDPAATLRVAQLDHAPKPLRRVPGCGLVGGSGAEPGSNPRSPPCPDTQTPTTPPSRNAQAAMRRNPTPANQARLVLAKVRAMRSTTEQERKAAGLR
jgi:hypothetical protein